MGKEFCTLNILLDDELCEKGCKFDCGCGVIHDNYYYCFMHQIIKNTITS